MKPLFKALIDACKMNSLGNFVESNIQKIVQNGERTLVMMKPKKQTFVKIRGVGHVEEQCAQRFINEGHEVLGRYDVITKDLFARNPEGNIELLTTTLSPNAHGKMEKSLSHVINYGDTNNMRQNLLIGNRFVRTYTRSMEASVPHIPIS